jgi:hypothetical protein
MERTKAPDFVFEARGEDLYINDRKVLKAWESFSGWYWFAVEKVEERVVGVGGGGSIMADGREVSDTIWFGLVQGHENEWGYFSQAEIESVGKYRIWPIRKVDLPFAGRRS